MPLPKIETPSYDLVIPSTGEKIKYRPFLVKEEKILLIALETEDEKQIINAIQDIIESCVESDLNARNLAMFDVEYIFLQLRSKSKGEQVDLMFECESCKKQSPFVLNLNEVQIERTEGHDKEIKLANNIGVTMKYPSIELKEQFSDDKTDIENVFSSLIMCLEAIFDNEQVYSAKDHTVKELEEFFDALPESEFQKIQKFFETMPALRHKLDLKCEQKVGKGKNAKICGHHNTKTLEGLQSFFG